jgi:hypothetical protein
VLLPHPLSSRNREEREKEKEKQRVRLVFVHNEISFSCRELSAEQVAFEDDFHLEKQFVRFGGIGDCQKEIIMK